MRLYTIPCSLLPIALSDSVFEECQVHASGGAEETRGRADSQEDRVGRIRGVVGRARQRENFGTIRGVHPTACQFGIEDAHVRHRRRVRFLRGRLCPPERAVSPFEAHFPAHHGATDLRRAALPGVYDSEGGAVPSLMVIGYRLLVIEAGVVEK